MSYKYRFPDGSPCPHPTSYEQACEVKSRLYDNRERCKKCNSRYTIRYTKTQECVSCSQLKAISLWHLHKGYTQYIWTDEDGKHWAEASVGQILEVSDEQMQEMKRLVEITNSSVDYTITDQQCKTHGHYGMKRLGKCYECQQKRTKLTPRQEALHNGETWYTPDVDCPRCNQRALRNVHNGSCQGCNPPRDNRITATSIMMDNNPNMVISREHARDLEMTVYRTGEPCSKGHTGWRYVSTGNCIPCKRGEQ